MPYKYNFNAMQVVEKATGRIITIKGSHFNPELHSFAEEKTATSKPKTQTGKAPKTKSKTKKTSTTKK